MNRCHPHRRRTAVPPLLASAVPPLPAVALPSLPAWMAAAEEHQPDSSSRLMRRRRALALVPFPPDRIPACRRCTLWLCCPRQWMRRAGLLRIPCRRPTVLCRRVRWCVSRDHPLGPPALPRCRPAWRPRWVRCPQRRRPQGSHRGRKSPLRHRRSRALQRPREPVYLDWLQVRHLYLPKPRPLRRWPERRWHRWRLLQPHRGWPQCWRNLL